MHDSKMTEQNELPKWANWLARDKDGTLTVFESDIYKEDDYWEVMEMRSEFEKVYETDDTYAHITWTDEEPARVNTGFHRLDNELVKETVDHPDHYQSDSIEVIDVIEAYDLNFNLGNVIKYVLRADKKNDRVEDLRKAQWYINRELEREEE